MIKWKQNIMNIISFMIMYWALTPFNFIQEDFTCLYLGFHSSLIIPTMQFMINDICEQLKQSELTILIAN